MQFSPIKLALAAAITILALPTQAAVYTVDPSAGLHQWFSWDKGLGEVNDSFEVTAAGASTINVMLDDCCVPGDEFALKLDGSVVSWTTSGYVSGLYEGVANQVLLSAGKHTFTIDVTALAPDWKSGRAAATFSGLTPAVPEPESYALMLAGLGVAGLMLKRRRAAR